VPTPPTGPVRPYVVLSCAISADGCLDDTSPQRLILSGPQDLDEVDELRAAVDAILVGAGTIRADDPRLLVRSPSRGAARVRAGRPPHPLRIALTSAGDLDPHARFFTGPARPLVYCADRAVADTRARLGHLAAVAGAGDPPTLERVLTSLSSRAAEAFAGQFPGRASGHGPVESVLIEGGSRLLRDALAGGLADELRLAVAPFFVGDADAPRFGLPAAYPHTARHPMRQLSVRDVGGVAVLRYGLSDRPRPETLPPA
jgi:5-amino-6-(5-phosphoribosylamino)uracil reductase